MTQTQVSPPVEQPEKRSWLMPKIRIEHIWLSIPILLTACFGFLLKLRLVDFWWHLKVGEIIVTTRSLPTTDLFSFTCDGKQFILQNWLVEILYFLLYRTGGLSLIVFVNAVLLVLALLPIYQLCREAAGRHLRLGVVAALMPATSLLYFGSVRTQVFSFILFGVYYWILSGYRQGLRDWLWSMPVLMALWVNLHGAFVLGLGLIGLFLICETGRHLAGAGSYLLSSRQLLKLAAILVLCTLATLANPETYRLYSYVQSIAGTAYSRAQIVEWQIPSIIDMVGILLFYAPFFLTLLVLLYARLRPDITEVALFVAFTVFALMAIRNAVWFVLIAAPIVARYLPSIDWSACLTALRRFRPGDNLARWIARRGDAQAPIRYGLNRQIAAVLLTLTVLVSPWVYPHLGNRTFGATLWEKSTPVQAMDYIQQHELTGHIFHPQIYGDYMIWRLWPQQKTFIDGRVHLFDDHVIQDYRFAFRDLHWEERLAKYEIKYLLLSKEEEDNQMMIESARNSTHWRLLYEDESTILFERG